MSKPLRLDGSVFFIDKNEYILKIINVEIAETLGEIMNGLMGREPLTYNQGMLFIFDIPQKTEFWMKNVSFPLDMIFIDKNKKIIKIEKNVQPFSENLISSDDEVLYAIEVLGGFCDKFEIDIGWQIMYRKGMLRPDK